MKLRNAIIINLLALACIPAMAADARERGFISKGMPEGEVIFRIGKPDHEALIKSVRGQPEEKSWTYFPNPQDPQTLTILTLKAGIVVNTERKIAR